MPKTLRPISSLTGITLKYSITSKKDVPHTWYILFAGWKLTVVGLLVPLIAILFQPSVMIGIFYGPLILTG
jgi:hypothetical protein